MRLMEQNLPPLHLIHITSHYMGVSKNSGIPKWIVFNGKPYQNGWFGGKPTIFGNIHINCSMLWEPSSPSGSSVFDGWITHIHAANFHFSTKAFPHLWNWCFHRILQCRPCFPGNGPKKSSCGSIIPKALRDTQSIPAERSQNKERHIENKSIHLQCSCSWDNVLYHHTVMPLCRYAMFSPGYLINALLWTHV